MKPKLFKTLKIQITALRFSKLFVTIIFNLKFKHLENFHFQINILMKYLFELLELMD